MLNQGQINFGDNLTPSQRVMLDETQIAHEGHEEALKDHIRDQEESGEKLNKLVHNSSHVLCTVKTVFPFTIFPHTLNVTLNDVNVVFVEFFISKQLRSIPISKVAEVIVTTGFFFAQLRIIDKDYSQITIEIDYLPIQGAMRAKRLIQGLTFANKENIDLTKIEDEHLDEKIEELGRVQGEMLDSS